MKNLIEIAQLVDNIKLKTSDFIVRDSRKKNKTDVFYEKILAGDFRTDQDASNFFYGTDTNHSNYKNLKRSLRKKLLSSLFFLESQQDHSDYARAYLYCCKYFFAAKILLFLQSKKSGVDLCKKVMVKALPFELTEFVLGASRYLRMHYATRMGDEEKFQYYNELFKKHLDIWTAESLAEEYFSTMVLPNVRRKANNKETFRQATAFYEELKPYLEKYTSPYLHVLGNYIQVSALMSINDYHQTIEVCEKAIAFFESKSYSYLTPLRIFLHNQLICHIQLRNYEKGKEVALKSGGFVKPGTNNWYSNKELHLILALHSKHYREAELILESATKHSKYKQLLPSIKERWLIYETYVNFLGYINLIPGDQAEPRKYKLGKFLNSVPTFSKDKRGLNIPILIIQILYLIIKKDYGQTIDRFEAIEKYCSRYILKDENLRSNCFIKMLLQIPNSDFHKAGVERRAKKYLTQLQSVPLEIASQAYEVEIIPYEDLWEIAMQSLTTKFHKVGTREYGKMR